MKSEGKKDVSNLQDMYIFVSKGSAQQTHMSLDQYNTWVAGNSRRQFKSWQG